LPVISEEMLRGANEIEMGKQFARSKLTKGLEKDPESVAELK
jgi:hypothetical protein